MTRTLNQLIEAAVLGGEEAEHASPPTTEVVRQETEQAPHNLDDIEKIASALEFLGRKGVATLLQKQAGKAGEGTLGTDAQRATSVPHADTTGTGHGTSHPALATNAGAIAFNKKEKAKSVTPALKKVLNATPFADRTLRENLSHTESDKNINKHAHDLSEVRKELERRAAAGGA